MSDINQNALRSIIKQESICKEATKRKHNREIEIFAGILNVFISGFNNIGSFEVKDDNEAEYIWLLLLTRSMHSIRCSIDLILKGYYSQAIALVRTVTEDSFICGNALSNKEMLDCLLHNGEEMPKYKKLAKKMGALKIYEDDYHYQSEFSHSSKLSLRVLKNPNTNEMRIAPIYDETLFLLCAELLMRAFLMIAEYMGRFLYYIEKDKAKAWDDENIQKVKNVTNWLKELKHKYGKISDTTNQS